MTQLSKREPPLSRKAMYLHWHSNMLLRSLPLVQLRLLKLLVLFSTTRTIRRDIMMSYALVVGACQNPIYISWLIQQSLPVIYDAAAALLLYMDVFIEFCINKQNSQLNHMEQNLWNALHCGATHAEFDVLAICLISIHETHLYIQGQGSEYAWPWSSSSPCTQTHVEINWQPRYSYWSFLITLNCIFWWWWVPKI